MKGNVNITKRLVFLIKSVFTSLPFDVINSKFLLTTGFSVPVLRLGDVT